MEETCMPGGAPVIGAATGREEGLIDLDGATAEILRRCAKGELSPEIALLRLLIAHRDVHALRAALDALARRADRDSERRDAIACITGVLDANPEGGALALRMLEEERAAAGAGSPEEELERWRHLFDRFVHDSAAASVALYSLGNPDLLEKATGEVVELLERSGVLGPERHVLEIGCGIGRFAQALAARVAAVTGVDIAPGMIEAARRRCAGLPTVTLRETSGRDLSPFPPASFDVVLAVDAMPYIWRAGAALVAAHFAEVARVLRPGGDFVILNLSYRGDLELDRQDALRLGEAAGLRVLRNGAADLRLWDGTTFHLRKREIGAVGADQPTRFSMRP
jgi:SAM-dependent methyltransferase